MSAPDPIALAVGTILSELGYDITRDGLRDTPGRVARFLRSWHAPQDFNFTVFDGEKHDEMIVQSDIPFYSMCEHHMLPFFGTATVAYIPGPQIVGLSKLARCVQAHASRLQNQERITSQVAASLDAALPGNGGVAVLIKARHMCMEMRGVRCAGAETTTSKLLGAFRDDHRCRAEFLDLAR